MRIRERRGCEQPRFVVTCNFETFRVYDRDAWAKSQLIDHPFEFTLAELVYHPEYLSFITDPANSRLEKEKEVSIHAGELIGKLYDRMRQGYIEPDSAESMHALNVLCVRLVFCLFCEDADLTPRQKKNRYARLHQQMCTLKFFETLRAEWIQNGGPVTLAAQGGDRPPKELVIIEQLVDGVHAVAADGREDVVEHPRLELLGGGQIGGDNQPVQVALADEPDLLDATSRLKGVVIHDPLTVTHQGIFRVGVAEGGGDIPTAEQDLPAGGDGSDRAELVVGERL